MHLRLINRFRQELYLNMFRAGMDGQDNELSFDGFRVTKEMNEYP